MSENPKSDASAPDRRSFMKRLATAVVAGPPVFAMLGATSAELRRSPRGRPAVLSFALTKINSASNFNIGMPPDDEFSGACGSLSFKGSDEELQALREVRPGARGEVRLTDADFKKLLTDDGTLVLNVDARVMTHPYFGAQLTVNRSGFRSVRGC